MTYVVNIHEATTQLFQLIERASRGERIVIVEAGKPIVDLVPHRDRLVVFGCLKGQVEYDEAVFDVDPDIQAMFYGDAADPA
ncbi:type II toxin-antitoxin system Phd/YefM family antitoxin [Glycomyces dulcitolivorans]|jgi:prevent-host-death family protein|uniref:type II toxin-antitoxin system Phd/YefM family antitoxin n=1 Tax=Glycomyces dulcitolivorans TaxID=2200759 RepID=UPI000DD451C3|nr:type II toxin-antitoxin system prevent-host-death family antitoxin [Glycomyces dulcitolivorans]